MGGVMVCGMLRLMSVTYDVASGGLDGLYIHVGVIVIPSPS